MTDSSDYRLLLNQRFDEIDKSLNRIETHLEKQNGSIARLQDESNKRAVVVENFHHLEKELD